MSVCSDNASAESASVAKTHGLEGEHTLGLHASA